MARGSTGFDVVLKTNTGTVGAPAWTEAGSQRDVSFSPTRNTIDVSSKEGLFGQHRIGMHNETCSLSALFIPTDAGFLNLLAADRAGEEIQVMRADANGNIEWAYAIITGMPQDFPYEAEATLSCELLINSHDGSDPWTAV